jgi:phosphoglycolate/pyridoxal phosphate phosphatase family enzyme
MAASGLARRSAGRVGTGQVSEAAAAAWLAETEAILFDCDGVIWRGTTPVPGAAEAVLAFREAGKRVVFVSNNSTKTRTTYVEKLESVCGIKATEDEIISSAFAASALLASLKLEPAEGCDKVGVFVVGEKGLHEELQAQGFNTHSLTDEESRSFVMGDFKLDSLLGDVQAVVQGFDMGFNYGKLATAASYIRYKGAKYIATNTDETFPVHGLLLPGSGSMVASLRTGCGTEPEVAGKPSPRMMELICSHIGVTPDKCIMVGDRLNTDIRFGNSTGAKTALVMTGVTNPAQLAEQPHGGEDCPDLVLDTIADFTPLLELLRK